MRENNKQIVVHNPIFIIKRYLAQYASALIKAIIKYYNLKKTPEENTIIQISGG
jgi:hypothetical protein